MRVAVVGLGAMGAAIARRLEDSEHELTVWNRSQEPRREFAERGVTVAESARAALEASEVCVTMLSDGGAVTAVAEDLFSAPLEGPTHTWVEMSTIDIEGSARLAELAAAAGVEYLRAPVSGNPGVVVAGNLTIVASGPAAALEQARPVLGAIGPNLFHVGEAEQARAMKLALNLMIAASTQMLAEALTLGEANGLERAKMLEVMQASAVGSPFVKYKSQALIDDDYTSTFSASLLAKDLDLIVASANSAGVPVPLAAQIRQTVQACVSAGMGDLDLSALLPLLRREAGLTDSLPEATT